MKIVAIIQARMSSSRLPGKVLRDIVGQPMLVHVVERTRLARAIDQVVVATTSDSSDDSIAALCQERDYPCYRGSLYDVLDRYYQAARAFNADVIVRITSDCPLIDPEVVDKTVLEFLGITKIPYDFAANRLPQPWGRTYPVGLDTEVCTFDALELAWREAKHPYEREHVMPFFYEQPERFRILHVNHEVDYGALRWTVDTPEDLELIRQIFMRFPNRQDFSWLEVLALFEREPELAKINAQIKAKDFRQSER
jgi:spore coat polysaccharide biosynthesis protein SpsF